MPSILDSFPVGPMPCDTLVFRAIRNSWKEQGQINSIAFYLRILPQGVEEGLSVSNNVANGLRVLRKAVEVRSLHVGNVRSLSLDVIANKPYHAAIYGCPAPDDKEAERIATDLLKQSKKAHP